MDINKILSILDNAIEGNPNSCLSEHVRKLAAVRASLASGPHVVAAAPSAPPPQLALEVCYSMSAGNQYDGKSVCLWRQEGVENRKIARFQNTEAAALFAKEFHFPLSKKLKEALEQKDE